jgi:hypothetical protein
MKITVEFDQNHHCLVGKFVGVIEPMHVKEYAQEVLKLARFHDCKRFLNDMREAEINMSFADLYYATADAVVEEFDRSWKRAILVKELTKEIEFWEVTATNKGITLKIFDNYNEALAWLS